MRKPSIVVNNAQSLYSNDPIRTHQTSNVSPTPSPYLKGKAKLGICRRLGSPVGSPIDDNFVPLAGPFENIA